MLLHNTTALDTDRLRRMFLRHTAPYRHEALRVGVRYSRGADFSGTCFIREGQIYVNLGRHVRYPYRLGTQAAKARSGRGYWWRETYHLTVFDGYQLALFVYLHELFHYLVKLAGRSPRRKESACDRFATRILVNEYGCPLTDGRGRPAPRANWDFQDLDRLVAKARAARAAPRPEPTRIRTHQIPVRILGLPGSPETGSGFLFEA